MEITDLQANCSLISHGSPYISYQLYIDVPAAVERKVGKLGRCTFPQGTYVYTGSARKNIRGRVLRHLSARKNLHWHIDYLLSVPGITISKVVLSEVEECELNAATSGEIVVRRFGATDCRHGCVSHLKFFDNTKRTNRQTQSNAKHVRQI